MRKCDKMSQTGTDDNIIQRMRIAWRITQARTHTHTHTKYLILIAS